MMQRYIIRSIYILWSNYDIFSICNATGNEADDEENDDDYDVKRIGVCTAKDSPNDPATQRERERETVPHKSVCEFES